MLVVRSGLSSRPSGAQSRPRIRDSIYEQMFPEKTVSSWKIARYLVQTSKE